MNTDVRIRKRVPKSCRRCHRRKQRCVGFPTCTNCESVNQPCLRSEAVPSWHHAMSKGALVHRIEALETQLAVALEGSSDSVERSSHETQSPSTDCPCHDRRNGNVTLLKLVDSEPRYLGPSSGMSIAENLGRIVHDAVWTKSIPVNASNKPDLSYNDKDGNEALPPDDELGSRILNAYFGNMHMRLPFLDRAEVLKLHASRNANVLSDQKSQFDRFKIFMVYAIGAAILQMTESYTSTPPSTFLATALQFDSALRESLTIAGAEAMMLLVLYNLRSSSTSSVWYMMGLAMRICLDHGLHREATYRKLKPYEGQVRRRLFWSIYIIERYVSWSLGRPFSVSEEEIDAGVPADLDDSITSDELIERHLHNPTNPSELIEGQNLRRFVASIRLQRIMSRIHSRIYRIDRNASTLVPQIAPLMASLDEFKASLPCLRPHEDDFIQMHWNNSLRMLLQRFLNILPPDDPLIATCLRASGQICQFFKRLRQRDSSGYSFLLVNSIFMAGLTMCFCLFRSPGLCTIEVSNDLRACSSAMFVMAERDPNLKKYRDSLESIITRAMEFVSDSSTLEKSGCNNIPAPSGSGNTVQLDLSQQSHGNTLGFSQGLDTNFFDWQGQHLIPHPPREQGYEGLGAQEDPRMLHPFSGIFTEDFWAGDSFSLHMADGADWRS